MSKEIPLTRGKVAIVDDDDFERMSKLKWKARRDRTGTWYAERNTGDQKFNGIGMHRMILDTAAPFIDHRNGDGLDNRRENLRPATHSQNQANRRRLPTNTSGYKGVTWNKKSAKWQAGIKVDGRSFHLGLHDTAQAAGDAYAAAAVRHFGEFAFVPGAA